MEHEKHLSAFRRLLADAQSGGQAKVDALLALSQRTVFAVPWGLGMDGYRTLVNSDGLAALPIFSDLGELERASTRFGWTAPDGSTPNAEIGARRAFTYAREKNIGFVVLDIAADYSLEVSPDEIEPLLSSTRREASGPYIGMGKDSSTLMEAVRASKPEGSFTDARPSQFPAPPPAPTAAPTTPPRILSSQLIFAPTSTPSEDLLDRYEAALRAYPEVEWACIGNASGSVAIALRIEPKLRKRFDQIAADLHAVSEQHAIIALDDPAHLRAARNEAFMFFPWRRK